MMIRWEWLFVSFIFESTTFAVPETTVLKNLSLLTKSFVYQRTSPTECQLNDFIESFVVIFIKSAMQIFLAIN